MVGASCVGKRVSGSRGKHQSKGRQRNQANYSRHQKGPVRLRIAHYHHNKPFPEIPAVSFLSGWGMAEGSISAKTAHETMFY